MRDIQETRKQLVDQLPQIFAAPGPQPEQAVKVESAGLAKEEHDDVPEDVDDIRGEAADRVAVFLENSMRMTSRLLIITTCLLSVSYTLAQVILPLDLSYLAGSAQAARINALIVARLYMASGLAIIILFYHEYGRALGTLILCAVVAEIVMLCIAENSGFEIGFLVSIPISGNQGWTELAWVVGCS